MDNIEQREESEFWREKKIIELEKEIEERDRTIQELNDQLFKTKEKALDLNF